MGLDFTAAEALDLASQIEGKAARFYSAVANACGDRTAAEMFATLSAIEAQHEQVFLAVRDGLAAQSAKPVDAQSLAYWPAVANSLLNNIDTELPKVFQNCKTGSDVLRSAMDFEKDAMEFFGWIKSMVPNGPDRQKVDQIMQEDMGHLISLGSQLANM